MENLFELLKAFLYGVLEGVTEWLPISSTGHLILLEDLIPFRFTEDEAFLRKFWEMFEVVIQLGAIFAVVFLFFGRLWPFFRKKSKEENNATWTLWFKVLVASIPAVATGILLDRVIEKLTGRDIDGWLYNAVAVAVALIAYGVAFILIERRNQGREPRVATIAEITYRQAFCIGVFQTLALVPGTSRSGSTILGAMLLGLSRTAAAEFSFFMAVPVMVGAGTVKLLGFFDYVREADVAVPGMAWLTLAVGCVVSFAVSMIAIRFLVDYVRRHSFSAFGVYRIVLGAAVLLWQWVR